VATGLGGPSGLEDSPLQPSRENRQRAEPRKRVTTQLQDGIFTERMMFQSMTLTSPLRTSFFQDSARVTGFSPFLIIYQIMEIKSLSSILAFGPSGNPSP